MALEQKLIENRRLRRNVVSLAQNFKYKWSSLPVIIPVRKLCLDKLIFFILLYGISILAVDYFVLSQSMRLTDGRTDIQISIADGAYAFAVAR